MANVNAPFGLRPAKHIGGASWNQQTTMYYIPSTDGNAFYVGDLVVSAAGGDATTGASAVTLALNTNRSTNFTSGNLRGVIVGIGSAVTTSGGSFPGAFDPNNLNVSYIPATKSVGYYVWVVDDPTVIFEAQCDSGTLATTSYNKNIAFLPTANTSSLTTTGGVLQSAGVLVTSTANTTSALPLKLIGAPNRPDNDLTLGYATYYVQINQSEFGNNTAGV